MKVDLYSKTKPQNNISRDGNTIILIKKYYTYIILINNILININKSYYINYNMYNN